ncbi:MAG: sensor histidine kinase [Lachnospiraceae bacterium]|nr:sensor histidine kinase [Lachnospiraceae bacterium]
MHFANSITRPISDLCARVKSIGSGDLTVREPIQAQEYEIQTLSDGFEDMVGRLNRLIEQNRMEQTRLRSAELALLQAQINPHFLYNTLDAIVWLIEMEKNEQAVEMVTSLSSFFRSSLSNGQDIISLREEEQHVRSYLEIQQVRYKDILEYEIAVEPELGDYRIPKLTLQPLVENALYHGIKRKRGLGHIRVSGYLEKAEGSSAATIVLKVEDNGAGMDEERLGQVRAALKHEQSIGFGIATVHERIQLMFGAEYGLLIESRQGAGTCVTVRIPPRID